MGNDDYKTRRQAAEILKVSEQTIDRYARAGLLESMKCGPRRVLIPSTSIRKLLTMKGPAR